MLCLYAHESFWLDRLRSLVSICEYALQGFNGKGARRRNQSKELPILRKIWDLLVDTNFRLLKRFIVNKANAV